MGEGFPPHCSFITLSLIHERAFVGVGMCPSDCFALLSPTCSYRGYIDAYKVFIRTEAALHMSEARGAAPSKRRKPKRPLQVYSTLPLSLCQAPKSIILVDSFMGVEEHPHPSPSPLVPTLELALA